MSDITPMAAVPSEVNYGRIRANFVAFIADDNGNVLEEVPLEGNVILTPTVGVLRFPSTSPPRTAVIQTLQCPVIGGILYPPGTPLGGPFPSQTGVAAVASDQPAGLPTTVQWTASFSLENTSAQPNPVTFEVPSGGVVDLTTVMPATPEPGIVVVVSTEDRERAEDAASAASLSAASAAESEAATASAATTATSAASDAGSSAATATASATTAGNHAASAANSAASAASAATAAANSAGSAFDDAAIAQGARLGAEAARDAAASSATAAQAAAAQDTGWRDVSAALHEDCTGTLLVRRIGARVTAMFNITSRVTTNFMRIWQMPEGWRPVVNWMPIGMVPYGVTGTALTVGPSGWSWLLDARRYKPLEIDMPMHGELSWLTNDAFPFPAAYPGTPA